MSLRVRLTLAFVLVVLVAILSMVAFMLIGTGRQVRQYMLRGGMVGQEALVNRLEAYYNRQGSWTGIDSFLLAGGAGIGHGPGGMMRQRLQLAVPGGQLIFDSDNLDPPGSLLPPVQLQQGIELQDRQGSTVGILIVNGGMSVGSQDVTPLLSRLNSAAFQAALVGGGLALLLGLILAGSLLRPIRLLTGAAERMTHGNLDQRVPVRGEDELASLGRAFNTMTDSLKQSEERRRAMTADIAHELRTPLSVQRAQLEALQDGIYPLTAENLQPALEQNILLTRLVEDLRTLALADAGELRLETVPVQIGELTERLVGRFRASAETRKIDLRLSVSPAGSCSTVEGDPLRLEQILNNLISNALRHTPEGGRVSVETLCLQDRVEVRVRDTGPGIPPETLTHIFERFYRSDRARSREEGGTGLGLAIARQLALAHGGDIMAANDPGGGALFVLSLPVSGNRDS